MHIVEPLKTDPSHFEFEIAIEKLKRYMPAIDQTPAEIIQIGGNKFRYEIHELINSVWNKERLPQQWKTSITVSTY
jgi:hypothetical protein